MVTGEAISISAENATELISKIGNVGLWLQTIGVLAIIWFILSLINWIINARRISLLHKVMEDMKRIEGKIDRLGKRK